VNRFSNRWNIDPWLLAVIALALLVNAFHLQWGLPNGSKSWAADAVSPLTVLSIAKQSFSEWNSGWFYFKYPLGFPLVLLAAFSPYLAFLMLTGQLASPSATYPYGFADPEASLYVMALIGRAVNVAFVIATAILTYDIGRRLFSRNAGRLAALFVVTLYPIIYYAHTTNLYLASLCWLTLALWGTVVATETQQRRYYVILGFAAAMAVSTKEQDVPFLLPLPFILAYYIYRTLPADLGVARRSWRAVWNPNTRVALYSSVLTAAFFNNAFFNPSGALNRILNLAGYPIEGVTSRLTPVEFALFKGFSKELMYFGHLLDRSESMFGLGLILFVVAGLIYVVRYHPRAAVFILAPAAAYYFFALRTHATQIALRYVVPFGVTGALLAAALCAVLLTGKRRRYAVPLVAWLCVLSVLRAGELNVLLYHDSRYQAEEWIQANVERSRRVEVFQNDTYLPRLPGYSVQRPPLAERTIAGVMERKPDVIIVSSAAKMGVTHRWNPNWREGNTLVLEEPGAGEFLAALEAERLPYRRVAQFSQSPILIRSLVTSLFPEITVFEHTPAAEPLTHDVDMSAGGERAA